MNAPEISIALPTFRYHPDPIASGSVVASTKKCRACRKARGYIYTASTYAEDDLVDCLCPWCIADGTANKKYDATFVDSEAFDATVPEAAVAEICERTPGFASWQPERWPHCCGHATAFLEPAGTSEISAKYREHEYTLMTHVVHTMGISGGAATRLVDNLKKDAGPTAYVFRCLHCAKVHFEIDTP